MKRILTSIALVCALCACNKELAQQTAMTEPVQDTKVIRFGLDDMGLEMKAVTEVTASDIAKEGSGIMVAGINASTKATLFNEVANYNGSVFETSNGKYYFPTSQNMNFYAAFPKTQAISIDEGAATIAYTHNSSTDLVAAKNTGVAAQDNAVALAFDHILSQVCFSAKGSDDQVTYKVKAISVKAPTTGVYAYGAGTWTAGGTTASETYASNDAGIAVATNSFTAIGAGNVAGAKLTFIPTTLTVSVTWECYSGAALVATYTKEKTFTPVLGKRNTVKLTLPNSDAKSITFSITVNDWTNGDDIDVTMG